MPRYTNRIAAVVAVAAVGGAGVGAGALALSRGSTHTTTTVVAAAAGSSNIADSTLSVGQIAKATTPGVVEIDSTSSGGGSTYPVRQPGLAVGRGNRLRLRHEGRHRHERPRRLGGLARCP